MEKTKRKVALTLVLILVFCTVIAPPIADAQTLRVGSRGEQVRTVQTKLKRWGYYYGAVDGVFGTQTKQAVEYFQRRNGLRVDGIVGPQTLKALGMSAGSSGSSNSSGSSGGSSSNQGGNLYLLAQAVHGEARGEPYKGQVAVAAVVLNRVKSPDFPNSIAGVVYQKGAFTAVEDGQINLTPNESSMNAARDAMNGWDPTNGCLFYYNPATATNKWMKSQKTVLTIGKHAFF